MKTYTYWINDDNTEGAFHPGEEVPTLLFEEGEIIHRVYVVHAETFEEAQAIHYLRSGWIFYPMGEPLNCPWCANKYYEGSGECFCGYNSNEV